MIWLRPRLAGSAPPIDCVLFDVDGVLVDVSRSYRLSVIAAATLLARTALGLPRDAPEPLVTESHIAQFKQAGGFNNDWDLTRLLAGLLIARAREWRGTPQGEMTLTEWAQRAADAARKRQGGPAWMVRTVPATALPDADVARWAHDEFYWGAALLREVYARDPRSVLDAAGYVRNEVVLLEATLLPALVAQGVAHFGLITGRNGPEVGWVLRRLAEAHGPPSSGGLTWHASDHGDSPFAVIVEGGMFSKPDPAALVHAVRAVRAHGALYVGDTADDLDLVLRYRVEAQPSDSSLPPVLAVMIAGESDARQYRDRGADLVIDHVRELPAALRALHGTSSDVNAGATAPGA